MYGPLEIKVSQNVVDALEKYGVCVFHYNDWPYETGTPLKLIRGEKSFVVVVMGFQEPESKTFDGTHKCIILASLGWKLIDENYVNTVKFKLHIP